MTGEKTINIDVPEQLHEDVKSAAPKRKKTLKQAYAEALRAWLGNFTGGEAEAAEAAVENIVYVPPELAKWWNDPGDPTAIGLRDFIAKQIGVKPPKPKANL